MASQTSDECRQNFIATLTLFPPVINEHIDAEHFLKASVDIVGTIERISKAFDPVKSDMMGNIEKIKKCYDSKNGTVKNLFDLIRSEMHEGGGPATGGLLWLNRALLFIELIFQQVVTVLQTKTQQIVSMTKILTTAYEGSVKKYHNWFVQQLVWVICKTSPSLPQILKSFNVEDVQCFEQDLRSLIDSLHMVRCEIDKFYTDNKLVAL